MQLTGTQAEALQKALMSAYFNRSELSQLLRFRLNRRLDHIAGSGALRALTLEVIDAAEGEGWTDELIRRAYEYRPGNPELKRFYERYTSSAQREIDREADARGLHLEKIVRALNGFVDVRAWRERLQAIETCVSRVELGGPDTPLGTGFLVAPDVLLTNHHVLASVLDGADRPGDVVFRFDHHRLADGSVTRGTEHHLRAGDWLLAQSPPSPDVTAPSPSGIPGLDALDYALVRLAETAASDSIDGRPRGFVPLPGEVQELAPGAALIIVQHSNGGTQKLAIDTDAVTSITADRARVRYRTNTEPGSSGSPCFTMDWNLVALHHGGDPGEPARYNEGIPIQTLRDNLPPSARAALNW